MILFGTGKSKIGSVQVQADACQHCGYAGPQTVMVHGRYFHIFFIPVFPVGSKTTATCPQCKTTKPQRQFSQQLHATFAQSRVRTRRPAWHFLGLMLIGIAFAAIALLFLTAKSDPRTKLLDADEKKMVLDPSFESDSISYKLDNAIGIKTFSKLLPDTYKFYSDEQADKVLVLIQIPQLKEVEKDRRPEILELVKAVLDEQAGLEGKDRYIGIKGKWTFLMVKTPIYFDNSTLALSSNLLDFYGPEEE